MRFHLSEALSRIGKLTLALALVAGYFSFTYGYDPGSAKIFISASLDGEPWSGSINYFIEKHEGKSSGIRGKYEKITAQSVTYQFDGSRIANTATYISGGPEGAVFIGIHKDNAVASSGDHNVDYYPGFERQNAALVGVINYARGFGCAESVNNISYCFVFETLKTIEVNATLGGQPWSGPVTFEVTSEIHTQANQQFTNSGYNKDYDIDIVNDKITGQSVPSSFDKITGDKAAITNINGGPPDAELKSITNSELDLTDSKSGTITLNYVTLPKSEKPVITPKTAKFTVQATLDGKPWAGNISYNIEGPGQTIDQVNLATFEEGTPGNYTVSYVSGGPEHAKFTGVNPAGTAYIALGGEASFTFNFKSLPDIKVQATLDGKPWEGDIDYTLKGPQDFTGKSVAQTFKAIPDGTYSASYASGGPEDAWLVSVNPPAVNVESGDSAATITLEFVSRGSITVTGSMYSSRWEGPCSYIIKGPVTFTGSELPFTFTDLPLGEYTISYRSGGPDGYQYYGVAPSNTLELTSEATNGKATIKFVAAPVVYAPPAGADLSVTLTADLTPVHNGNTFNFIVTLTNGGPENTSVTVHFLVGVNPIMDNTLIPVTMTGGTYNGATGDWTVTVNAGTSKTLTIPAVAIAVGGPADYTAEVTASDKTDPDSAPGNANPAEDDQSTLSITVLP